MKRLRIVSKVRFITFVVVMILLGALIVAGVLGLLTVSSSSADHYKEVSVQNGDTLWEIAAEYYPGEDVRKHIYDICELNGISAGDLKPGQTLILPVEH